jgi:hypothetical protein
VRATRAPAPIVTIPGNALGPRSPRDPRRVWARNLPTPLASFTNPAAVDLVEWAAAILHAETWAAWQRAHPEGDPL